MMADLNSILPGNIPGTFFVDSTCIDCDLCRQIAPTFFKAEAGYSVVCCQPRSSGEMHDVKKAILACPTGSIGSRAKLDLGEAVNAYPDPVEANVYFCGYSSRDSFGASSYLIVRPEGNVLIDSPRFTRRLVNRLEEMGGVSTMFLTHRDDVADHEKFHAHFGCKRIIHESESSGVLAEQLLRGIDATSLDDSLIAIPTPGHTKGHVVLLYQNFLFTGDHLAWSPYYKHLVAFRHHNWYSWSATIRSMSRLLEYNFEWILPGHGRRAHYHGDLMRKKISECVEWMKQVE